MSTKLPPNGLQTLILDRKRDRSYVQLEKDCGGKPTKSNLQRLASEPIKDMPTTDVLRGLAKGLNVRVGEVVRAAAVSVGLPMVGASPDDLVIEDGALLPHESQQALLDTAANMLWWKEQVEETKTAEFDPDDPANYDLAAHPNFETNRDRFDKEHGRAGEENQDTEGAH